MSITTSEDTRHCANTQLRWITAARLKIRFYVTPFLLQFIAIAVTVEVKCDPSYHFSGRRNTRIQRKQRGCRMTWLVVVVVADSDSDSE